MKRLEISCIQGVLSGVSYLYHYGEHMFVGMMIHVVSLPKGVTIMWLVMNILILIGIMAVMTACLMLVIKKLRG